MEKRRKRMEELERLRKTAFRKGADVIIGFAHVLLCYAAYFE